MNAPPAEGRHSRLTRILLFGALALLAVLAAVVLAGTDGGSWGETSGTCGSGLQWTFDSSDGSLTITGSGYMEDYDQYETRWGGNEIVTATFDYGVSTIGDYAFYGCTSLVSVDLPDSLSSIGVCSFCECTSLTSVSLPSGLIMLNSNAFRGCTSLEGFEVDPSNTDYRSQDGIVYDKDMKTLVAYPNGKKDASFTVPDTVTSLGIHTVLDCRYLTDIEVGGSNTAYSSADGCLLSKDGTELIICPSGRESCTVGSGVTDIPAYAFRNGSLKEVVFSDGGKVTVHHWAFLREESLERIVVPEGADLTFLNSSLSFEDSDTHTVYVTAPEGYAIPGSAVAGGVSIVYGEPPGPEPPGPEPTPPEPEPEEEEDRGWMVYLAVAGGIVLTAFIALGAVMYFRHNRD